MTLALSGKRFGRLTAVICVGSSPSKQRLWTCRCDCGKEAVVPAHSLTTENTRSCGCLAEQNHFKHGYAPKGKPRCSEYITWVQMRHRCYLPISTGFKNYGGRGITVCDRWRDSFENFLEDMGPKPSPGHSIDRVNNDGPYEKSNCRWASRREQSRNKRGLLMFDFRGQRLCLAEIAELTGMRYGLLHQRIKRGLSLSKALQP